MSSRVCSEAFKSLIELSCSFVEKVAVLSKVNKDELRKVPYITHIPSDGRTVFLQPYLDKSDNKFKVHVPQGETLTWVFAEPVEACYYSEKIIDESKDIYLTIIDIVARHYSFGSVINTLIRIMRDILNSSVIVEKYFVFLDLYRKTKNVLISNLVTTDLEYFFGNTRSSYDLLQSLMKDLWKRASGRNLPNSFYDMVKQDPENLKRRYGLPDPLINYYIDVKDFFVKCQWVRDSIYHRGLDIQPVFCMEDGFAFQKDTPLFPNPLTSEFDIWPTEKIKENGLVSVLALISHVNKELLENMDAFCRALIQTIQPPPAISETHKLFLRGPYVCHLVRSDEYLKKQWIEL
jgi:hypothetical protein